MLREHGGLSRRGVAAGLFAGVLLGAAACGEVTANPDAGDDTGEADAGGQAGGDDAGAAPDARPDCDDGFTGSDCAECTVFVDGGDGADGNEGLSWEDAVESVSAGIGRAATRLDSDDQERCSVWVREGTYVPGDSRDDSFELAPGVHLYGGFAGFETAREDRNVDQYETTLSGDIDASGDLDENAYHVVTATNIGAGDATLDGFTITAGHADGSGDDRLGGGMVNDDASPALENVVFTDNQASGIGGAMENRGDSAPTLINVSFVDNQAEFGGGMNNQSDSAPTLINVSFNGNQAEDDGGAILTRLSAEGQIFNSILWGNDAGDDGNEIAHESDEDLVIETSIVEAAGGEGIHEDGDGDLVDDDLSEDNPQFVDAPDDLRLSGASGAAIDAGDESVIEDVEFPDTDLAGEPRIVDGDGSGDAVIDLGAYEYQP